MMPLNYILRKYTGGGATNLLNRKERLITLCKWTATSLLQKNEKELETLIQTIRIDTKNIRIEFGIENTLC